MPLGLRVLKKIETIIRDELNKAGCIELLMPAIQPSDLWKESERWEEFGPQMLKIKDRHDKEFCFGPTHEEVITDIIRKEVNSYKQLPINFYQIQMKFRDEIRPRFGVMRAREFLMKDSYSFDVDDDGLQASYDRHRDAYISTFDRLGLPYVIVSAMSGAMGGSASEEFLAPIDVGEDTFVQCTSCGYAANTEAVLVAATPVPSVDHPAATVVDTPNTPTIDSLVEHLNAADATQRSDRPWAADDTLKNVVLNLVHPDGTVEPLAIGIPGNREVDLKRVEAQVAPAEPTPFTDADFEKYPSLVKGYIGPQALGTNSPSGIRYLVDPRIVNGTAWVTGANTAGHHVTHLVCGRDFTADGSIEAAEVLEGDPCSQCGESMSMARGIEIGHIFQLGRKYAEALDLRVLDADGKQVTVTMGSYGIGVSRAVAAIAESHHDEYGLCWPRAVAPADVHFVIAGKDDGPQRPAAETLAAEFEAAGIDVLFDDREGVSPGVRFKDAELIGVPTIVVVGRGITDGLVEVKDRLTGERTDMPIGEVTAHITALLANA